MLKQRVALKVNKAVALVIPVRSLTLNRSRLTRITLSAIVITPHHAAEDDRNTFRSTRRAIFHNHKRPSFEGETGYVPSTTTHGTVGELEQGAIECLLICFGQNKKKDTPLTDPSNLFRRNLPSIVYEYRLF